MIIKVSSKSRTVNVAGAIAGRIREQGRCEIHAIAAGAVNQAVKAISVAQDYLVEEAIEIVSRISMREFEIDGVERTVIVFIVTAL